MKTLIKNGLVLDMSKNQPNAEIKDILIEDNIISRIEKDIDIDNIEKLINAEGKAVMPGLVNCHNHVAMTLFRGYADDSDLMSWLKEKIWPAEEKLTSKAVYYGSALGIIEMLKSGTTTFNDMYFFMEDVAKACIDSGIRCTLGRSLIDSSDNDERITETIDLYRNFNRQANGRININIAAHAPYTCNPELIQKAVGLSKEFNVPLHIHLSETMDENNEIFEKYKMSPTQYLKQNGVFDVPVILAHGVWLSDEDVDIIKSIQGGISHNPISNLKLACGIAPIIKYKNEGLTIGLGTDGAGSTNTLDMFEQMKVCNLMQKVSNMEPTIINAFETIKMATIDGAKVLGLEKEIGSIECGKKADIIIIDLNKPHLTPLNDVYSIIVYSANGADVDTTIVDGKIVMENRNLLTMNEIEIIEKGIEEANKIL